MPPDWRVFPGKCVEVEIDISHMPTAWYEEPYRDVFSSRKDIKSIIKKAIGKRRLLIQNEDISGFNFSGMDLRKFTFRNCDLSYTDFSNTKVDGMTIENCNLTGAHIGSEQLQRIKICPRSIPQCGRVSARRMRHIRRRRSRCTFPG